LLPINFNGSAVRSIFRFDLGDFADRFATFAEARETFFGAGLLAATLRLGLATLRADRVLRAADFFAELFFFFGLAIA
jgi:hypothetical protein